MGKLVRDRIPEIIRQSGKTCLTKALSPADYRVALSAKLLEEVQEAIAPEADLPLELADVCEVLDAIVEAYGLNWQEIRRLQAERRRQRGGFAARIWLESVHDDRAGG